MNGERVVQVYLKFAQDDALFNGLRGFGQGAHAKGEKKTITLTHSIGRSFIMDPSENKYTVPHREIRRSGGRFFSGHPAENKP
jgi:hypothetical protein